MMHSPAAGRWCSRDGVKQRSKARKSRAAGADRNYYYAKEAHRVDNELREMYAK